MSFPLSEYTKIDVGWGLPQTPLGELTALPDPLAGFKGAASRQEGMEGRGRKDWGGERGKGKEKGEWEGRGREESWRNSALVVGG